MATLPLDIHLGFVAYVIAYLSRLIAEDRHRRQAIEAVSKVVQSKPLGDPQLSDVEIVIFDVVKLRYRYQDGDGGRR